LPATCPRTPSSPARDPPHDRPVRPELPVDIADRLRDSTRDIRTTLALLAAVVLFVGAFLIFNTLSMTVVERVREVGLLRAVGATRRQVMGIFLLQALVVGIIGTVVGIALGLALGAIVVAFLRYAEGIRVAGLAVTPMGLAFSVALGILVTAAAAAEPAWRAGRLSDGGAPIARRSLGRAPSADAGSSSSRRSCDRGMFLLPGGPAGSAHRAGRDLPAPPRHRARVTVRPSAARADRRHPVRVAVPYRDAPHA
jgi:hypothetical protein